MAIEFQCPSCTKVFRVEDKFGGKTAKCPGCESQIQIPAATAADPLAAPQAQASTTTNPKEVPPFMSSNQPHRPSTAPDINPFAASPTSTAATSPLGGPRGSLTLKRVDVGSAAKMMGAFYAFLGLLIGILGGLFSMVGGLANGGGGQAIAVGIGGGLAMMVFAPLFYGLIGVVGGAIGAVFYNLAAKYAGGLKFEVE